MKIRLLLILTCVYLVNIGNTQTFRGLSPNDLMVKSGAWYDVRAYNAGVATYSNNAINQAIDSCHANGGGTIYFPPGTYTLSDSVVLDYGITFKGSGPATVILGGVSSGPIFSAHGDNNITISDMCFAGVLGESGLGLRFSDCENVKIQNCTFVDLLFGIQLLGTDNENISVNACSFEGCTTEIHCIDKSALSVYGSNYTSYTPGSFQIESSLTVRTGDLNITTGNVTINAGDLEVTAGKLTIGDTLTLPGTITSDADLTVNNRRILTTNDIVTIKHPFWLGEDIFPLTSLVYKDTTQNNLTGTSPIVITSLTTTANKATVGVNWLPYRTNLNHPADTTHCWAAVCTNTWDGGYGPNRTGDATEIVRIDSANYSSKYLYCTYMNYASSFPLAEDDTLVIYNPFAGGWNWCDEPLLEPNTGTNWRYSYVSPGPTYVHSDGYLRMLINGSDATASPTVQTVGLIKVHLDSIFYPSAWVILNSDLAIIDTLVAKDRGRGILATSILPLKDSDAYIVYYMAHNATEAWWIGYLVIDEDGNILEDPATDIITNKPSSYDDGANIGTLSRGLSAPSVVRFSSEYLMLFTNRHCATTTYSALDHWSIWEATADNPRGLFTAGSDSILPSHNDNKFSYRSAYPDLAAQFVFKGRIYALLSGTSQWRPSGSKANRQWGLAYRSERANSIEWIEDRRSPLWINVMQKYTGYDSYPSIWGTGTGTSSTYYYASDHSGGYPSFYANPNDGYIYVFFGCNSGSDDYRVWGMRLNSEEW